MEVGDLVYLKKDVVLNLEPQGDITIEAGMYGRIISRISSQDRIANACSSPCYQVRISIMPMVSVTVLLRENDLILNPWEKDKKSGKR